MMTVTDEDIAFWKTLTAEELVDEMGGSFNRALAAEMIRWWGLARHAGKERVHNHDLDPSCREVLMGECRAESLDPENERLRQEVATYKDAFVEAQIANTAANKLLAEQEAKTVEYRAAWIKAQRERDHYRAQLLEERAKAGTLLTDWTVTE